MAEEQQQLTPTERKAREDYRKRNEPVEVIGPMGARHTIPRGELGYFRTRGFRTLDEDRDKENRVEIYVVEDVPKYDPGKETGGPKSTFGKHIVVKNVRPSLVKRWVAENGAFEDRKNAQRALDSHIHRARLARSDATKPVSQPATAAESETKSKKAED